MSIIDYLGQAYFARRINKLRQRAQALWPTLTEESFEEIVKTWAFSTPETLHEFTPAKMEAYVKHVLNERFRSTGKKL